MNARTLITALSAAAALSCLVPGCGPGLVPPRASSPGASGFAGARGTADASADNPMLGTKDGAAGSGSLPTSVGSAGQTAAPPPHDTDAGPEDAGEP